MHNNWSICTIQYITRVSPSFNALFVPYPYCVACPMCRRFVQRKLSDLSMRPRRGERLKPDRYLNLTLGIDAREKRDTSQQFHTNPAIPFPAWDHVPINVWVRYTMLDTGYLANNGYLYDPAWPILITQHGHEILIAWLYALVKEYAKVRTNLALMTARSENFWPARPPLWLLLFYRRLSALRKTSSCTWI
jgi:hypothetical protein